MARIAWIVLAVVVVLGLVVSFLPNPVKAPLGEVTLEEVELELFPAADPDARWVFKASTVKTNPDTRESVATLKGDGVRYIKGKPDLYLRTVEVTIDGSDNLRTQEAKIYIPKGCYIIKLGQPGTGFVAIDQNAGYTAPYADIQAPEYSQHGNNFVSDFAIEKVKLSQPELELRQGGKKTTCGDLKTKMGFVD